MSAYKHPSPVAPPQIPARRPVEETLQRVLGIDTSMFFSPLAGQKSVTWKSASDWDSATSENGVVHESVTNTDHDNAGLVRQGYSITNPYLDSDLALYLPLHEDSGTTVYDFSGNGNDGTVNSATVNQAGILDTSAISFDDTDDYLDIPYSSSLDITSAFTISAWIYLTGSNLNQVISKRSGWQSNIPYEVSVTGGGAPSFRIHDGSQNTTLDGSSGDVPTSAWARLDCVFTGTEMVIYVNATEVARTSHSNSPPTNSQPVNIGRHPNGGEYFGGRIAHVPIRTVALSQSEIQARYDVVTTAGSLTTAWKSGNFAATQLVTTSTIETAESIDIVVEQDVGSDGSVDYSQTVSLTGGADETNSLSGFASSNGRYRVRIKPGNSDVSKTATLQKATVTS